MNSVSPLEQAEAMKSMWSTIHKLQKALAKMTDEGASTTLIMKRLQAHTVGLALLESEWSQTITGKRRSPQRVKS